MLVWLQLISPQQIRWLNESTKFENCRHDPEASWENTYIYIYIHVYTSSTAQGGGGSFKNRKHIGEIGCCESGMAERIH